MGSITRPQYVIVYMCLDNALELHIKAIYRKSGARIVESRVEFMKAVHIHVTVYDEYFLLCQVQLTFRE
jgi:hypothetical protein